MKMHYTNLLASIQRHMDRSLRISAFKIKKSLLPYHALYPILSRLAGLLTPSYRFAALSPIARMQSTITQSAP